jgi:branched-chain amino acid transport system permease protein
MKPARSTVLAVAHVAIGLALIAVLPMVLSSYSLYLAGLIALSAIAIMGLGVLFGDTGQISVGHAGFVAVGAYVAGIVAGGTPVAGEPLMHVSPLVELIAVLFFSAAIGLVVGLPALRLSGLRLAIVTLAFAQLAQWLIIHSADYTGGEPGMTVPYLEVGPLWTGDGQQAFTLVALVALAVSVLIVRLRQAPIGRAMRLVRDSEMAARSVGIPVARVKLVAFVVAALCAGLSGMLTAHYEGTIASQNFDLFASVFLLVAVVVGGASNAIGSWVGAAYLVLVPEFAPNLYVLLSGVVIIAIIMVAPRGIAPTVGSGAQRLLELARRHRRPAAVRPSAREAE